MNTTHSNSVQSNNITTLIDNNPSNLETQLYNNNIKYRHSREVKSYHLSNPYINFDESINSSSAFREIYPSKALLDLTIIDPSNNKLAHTVYPDWQRVLCNSQDIIIDSSNNMYFGWV